MDSIKGDTQIWRYFCYFPTNCLSLVASFLYDTGVDISGAEIWGMYGIRKKQKKKHYTGDLPPYISLKKAKTTKMTIDYNFLKHAKLDLKKLLKIIGDHPIIDDIALNSLAITIPKKELQIPHVKGESPLMVAVFESVLAKKIDPTEESKFTEIIHQFNNKTAKLGFKYCCMDLILLIDSKQWASGSKSGININEDIKILRKIRYFLDPHRKFIKIRDHRLTPTKKWKLVSADIN